MTPPPDAAAGLLRQFLGWVAARPRTYTEAMEGSRTSCPRLSVWEDATAAGLVRVEPAPGAPQGESRVVLTEAGRAMLADAA